MGIADSLAEESLEYLRLEDFMTVLQFSLIDERSDINSFKVFSRLLDKGLSVRVSEIGCVGDGLRPHKSDVKVALRKVEHDLFDTNEPKSRIYKKHCITISNWDDVPIGDFLIKRSDVHDLYRDAYKQTQFPWALTKWPSSENEWRWHSIMQQATANEVEVPIVSNYSSNGLPATAGDYMEALKQDCWTAREAICWLKGKQPDSMRGDIEKYFLNEANSVRRAIEAEILSGTSSSPLAWVQWAKSKDWELPYYLSEALLNDEQIDWKYWATMPSINCSEAAKLSLGIDPIHYPEYECSLGKLTDNVKIELRKRERWLEGHSETWTMPQLVKILGDEISPDGMKQAAEQWEPNNKLIEHKRITSENLLIDSTERKIESQKLRTSSQNNEGDNKFNELKQAVFNIWMDENCPEMRHFFPAILKKYKEVKGSPIQNVYYSGKDAGIYYRLSNGNEGFRTKHTIGNWVTDFKKYVNSKNSGNID